MRSARKTRQRPTFLPDGLAIIYGPCGPLVFSAVAATARTVRLFFVCRASLSTRPSHHSQIQFKLASLNRLFYSRPFYTNQQGCTDVRRFFSSPFMDVAASFPGSTGHCCRSLLVAGCPTNRPRANEPNQRAADCIHSAPCIIHVDIAMDRRTPDGAVERRSIPSDREISSQPVAKHQNVDASACCDARRRLSRRTPRTRSDSTCRGNPRCSLEYARAFFSTGADRPPRGYGHGRACGVDCRQSCASKRNLRGGSNRTRCGEVGDPSRIA